MDYDYKSHKIVAIISSKLGIGVAFNVLGHLAVSIGYHSHDHMGRENLPDASGIPHLGISKYPVIITTVKPSKLRNAIEMARKDRRILLADYPRQMLETGHDDELAESMLKTREDEIEYLGAIMYGPAEAVDAISGRFSLWK